MFFLTSYFRKMAGLLTIFLASVGSPALAAVVCSGPVSGIRIGDTSELDVFWGFSYVRLCSFESDYSYAGQTYTPEQCRLIHATALTAMGTGNDFAMQFNTANTCSEALPMVNGQPPLAAWRYFFID